MEYVRSGERNFTSDPPGSGSRNCIRVNEQTKGHKLCLGFAPAGLRVYIYVGDVDDYVAVSSSRKSIGND